MLVDCTIGLYEGNGIKIHGENRASCIRFYANVIFKS